MGVKPFNVASLTKAAFMNYKEVGYRDSVDIIYDELQKTRKSFIKIGWYLKHINETDMYTEDGYKNIYEFAQDKFNISQPTATRFINLCIDFSVNHDSPELDEKYMEFSVSQLFEMLPMKEEEKEQITPEMTVREIRDIKKESKKEKKQAETLEESGQDDDIPGQTSIEEDFPEYMPDTEEQDTEGMKSDSYATSHKENESRPPLADSCIRQEWGTTPEQQKAGEEDKQIEENNVIDGEYREIKEPEPEEENVATLQLADIPKKCITGWSRYGVCSCCGNGGVQCCNQCEESCNSRCGWIAEPYSPEDESKEEAEPSFKDDLAAAKYILEREKKTLTDYIEVGGLPEMTREILFKVKAKRLDNGEWVEGIPIQHSDGDWQIHSGYSNAGYALTVDPETICRCTGKEYMDSAIAYEGDIFESQVSGDLMILRFGTYQAYCPVDKEFMDSVGFYAECEGYPDMPIGNLHDYALKKGNIFDHRIDSGNVKRK